MSRVRWTVVVLLFFAVTINYVDRAVIGVLKPLLDEALGWDQKDYGWMVTAFQAAYAIGYAVSGRLLDRFGIRLGFAVAVALWSVAAMAHGAMATVFGFSAARAALGLAEGGTLPAAVKAVSEWFPKEQRAFATGVFNAGSNVGAITCPIVVPWLAARWGWQGAFVATGAIGFAWLAVWLWMYSSAGPASGRQCRGTRLHPQGPDRATAAPIAWTSLLGKPQTWAFMLGMMASSPVWWFYIFWVPDFLNKQFGLGLTQSSLPLVVIFAVASLGGIGGGWLSSRLLRCGMDGQCRAQDRAARLLGVHPAGVHDAAGARHARVVGRGHRHAGGSRTLRVRRQSLHAGQRHGAAAGGEFGGRYRRHGRLDRGHVLRPARLPRAGRDRQQLLRPVCHRRLLLLTGARRDPPAPASPRADAAVERYLSSELQRERVERLSVEARLQSLRLQLDPQFLFNALKHGVGAPGIRPSPGQADARASG